MWFYRLVRAFILATVTVNANYFVSNESTQWRMATCNLAEPNLTYENTSYRVNQSTEALINNTDVWIGYQLAKIPFLFLGCGKWTILPNKTYNIMTIGDCYHLCAGGKFGIQINSGENILSNDKSKKCRCVASLDLNNGNQNGSCDRTGVFATIFSPINVNSSEVSTSNPISGDCLLYYYPKFFWGTCEQKHPLQVMCSTGQYTGSNTTAKSVAYGVTGKYYSNWSEANGMCLNLKSHPASMESITHGNFTDQQKQYYWTGIIRSIAMINTTIADILTIHPMHQFAFWGKGSRVLQFASECVKKKALCIKGSPTTERSNSSYSTDDVCIYEHSTTEASVTREFPIGVGIGVPIGILCIVGTIVAIFVLRRRGVLSCKLGTKTDEPDAGNLAFASRSYQETVVNHNNFILEKQAQSFEGNTNHYSTSDEPNVDNRETDHYCSIEEPYQTVKDDYDYTANALRTGPNTRKPDDIYNKLKLDRPGDYDHVGRPGNNMPEPGSDYDTSAFAQKIAGGDDYNHIPLRVSA